ncbi:hypothetical protein L210DRAFT_3431490 [Boletus edulis BED1]|uniref:DUF6830 domain-containing protein n=1 Tax=Boletus edulis BED1 TaxID=1328754 RepID=A0AAD4BB88_BOLED|nr:hypothetical protein L210DRAFT_3431490 [Boletus edulis BED1]
MGDGQTFLACFALDSFSVHRKLNPYYLFSTLADWKMANFLLTSGLSMRAINTYLSLELTKTLPLSFQSTKELRFHAEILPSGPVWKFKVVPTTHPTKQPVHHYYHNSLDCIESLFNNPIFAGKMDFSPYRLFTTAERIVRVYTEWMSSDAAWELQSQITDGSTLCGVILSSDKTNITNVCGGRVAHPLLISLTNIRMKTRNKASSHAFLLLVLMPIPQFVHPTTRICSVLEARLFHQCLDIVLEPLKTAARVGRMMSDPLGNLQCEKYCLSGVSHPFFRDWPLSCPSRFLTPECLHHWHRFFWDHDLGWCIEALGSRELNFRFSVLPPITGVRHFSQGVTQLKQITGRMQRNTQRYIVVVLAGFPDARVVTAIQVLMDFRYLAQAPAISSTTRDKIAAALAEFHQHKQAILDHGLHRGGQTKLPLEHFNFPKLELLHNVVLSINNVGSILQWTANTTEHAHIKVIKDPASMTNNMNYDAQICCTLDCDKKCRLFNTTIKLWSPHRKATNLFAVAQRLLEAPPGSIPSPLRVFVASSTAFHLNREPSIRRMSIDNAAQKFDLPDLRGALGDYVNREGAFAQNFHVFSGPRRSSHDAELPFNELRVWYKVCLQQKSYHDLSTLGLAFMVHAHPPCRPWKYGRYNGVLLNINEAHAWPSSGLAGHSVILVHMIMCPTARRRQTCSWTDRFLVYAERLDIVTQANGSVVEPSSGLHVLKRATRASGAPFGEIFPLDQLRSYCNLAPRFDGAQADSRLSCYNSIHSSPTMFLNKYIDKDFYYAVTGS